jgi:hypothetical protein
VEREGTGSPLKAVAEAQKRTDQMMSEAAKRSEQGTSAAGK